MKENKLGIAVITTEYNEVENIDSFINTVLGQSLKPDEIVITDAGSTDGTIEKIKQRIKNGDPIKLVIKKGNRSVGRNAAIKVATSQIIAVTDVGCELDKDWLKNITAPLSTGKYSVVSGFFKPKALSDFEKISTLLMTEELKDIDLKKWLPSSRSIAFTKEAWFRSGGYPEYKEFGKSYLAKMCGGEDTLFDLRLKDAGYEFADGLKAVAYWRPRKNYIEFFKQYWMYSVGDGIRMVDMIHYYKLLIKYIFFILLFIFLLFYYPLFILLELALFIIYLLKRIYSKWKKDKRIKTFVTMSFLVILYDLAQLLGFYRGVFARLGLPVDKRVRYTKR